MLRAIAVPQPLYFVSQGPDYLQILDEFRRLRNPSEITFEMTPIRRFGTSLPQLQQTDDEQQGHNHRPAADQRDYSATQNGNAGILTDSVIRRAAGVAERARLRTCCTTEAVRLRGNNVVDCFV